MKSTCRKSFDVVLLTDVLEHIEDDTRSAQRQFDCCEPGGIVVATVPAYQWLYSPRDAQHHHFRRYGKQAIPRTVDCGRCRDSCY